jgi:uncharacterized repeat protein (TIGR01451 family)
MTGGMRHFLRASVAGLVVVAGLAGVATLVRSRPAAAAPVKVVRNTLLKISPIFSETLVGGFDQAGNTLLDCAALTNGSPLPAGGCVRNITTALTNPGGLPFYNNQVIQKYLDRDSNPATYASSSATVNVPAGAHVVFAELSWLGTSQVSGNPNIQWNPLIYQQPMEMSVDDDQHYVSVDPDQGTSIEPGSPPSDTNDYYYSASADVTDLLVGRTGQITVWGANAPFPVNGFNMAGLGWNIVVVYQYPSVNLAAGQVGKQITVQEGFVYQQSTAAPTNTVVTVPAVTDPDDIQVGLIAGEGDAGLTGDQFHINGQNITHPVTGQTNNFFVSYAQGATNPNWTSNFSTDNVEWTLPAGLVPAGSTGITLTTTTSGDGYFLAGMATAIPVPSVGLTKTVAPFYSTVGAPLTYDFTVTNTSAVPIHTLSVTDPLFATGTNPTGDIPSCALAGTLAPAASYPCTATHIITVADIAAGHIDNTATVHALGAADEPLSNTASAHTVTNTNLSITKFGDPKPVHVGDLFTYTIQVTNDGPADAADVALTDALPAGFVPGTPTATNGATATITNGTLTATKTLLTLAAPNSFTVTVPGTISTTFTGTSIENTASVTAPNTNCVPPSADAGNCTATDTADVLQPAPITILKTADNFTPKPGESFHYAVEVHNQSHTTTAKATVDDPIPAPLTGATWTCFASVNSACTPTTGTGDIVGAAVTLAPLGIAAFQITVTVPADFQGGTIVNTATATPGQYTVCATPTSCSAPETVVVTPEPAQLTVEKSHTPINPSPPPGEAITYSVTVSNTSASTIAHGTFDDPAPPQIDTTGGTWTTATTGTGTTVTPASGTGFPTGPTIALTIAPGGTVTFTINAHVAATYDGSPVTNTATVTPGLNTSCEDAQPTCQADDSFTNPARLLVDKSHTPDNPSPTPGQQVTYHVTVTNPVSGVSGVGTFDDPLPPELDATTATWTCTAAAAPAGSSCGTANGTGSPTGIPITVASNGGTVTFTIVATIRPSPIAVNVLNIATVTPGADTECADPLSPCKATDQFQSVPDPATITITKTHSPPTPIQGDAVAYTVTVSNTSTTTQAQGTVDDPFDSPALQGITWIATASTGSTVNGAATDNGTGSIVGVPVALAPSGTVTFRVQATVAGNWPGGDVINTSTVTPGDNTECDPDADPSCSGTTTFPTPSLITIFKFHLPKSPQPGQTVTYKVIVFNLSDMQAATATIDDPLPPQLNRPAATWTTQTFGTGTAATPASGTGPPTGVSVTLAPEGAVILTVSAPIPTTFGGGTITNTATATAGENTACQDPTPTCDASTSFNSDPPPVALTITKTASTGNQTLVPGDFLSYTITVTNTSTSSTGSGTVTDAVPPGLIPGAWTATATPGSTVSPASGTGLISAAVMVAPLGRVTFVRSAQIDPTFTGSFNVQNVATLTPSTNSVCSPTDTTQACDADAVVPVLTPELAFTEPPSELPITGASTQLTVRLGALLLVVGSMLVVANRRRRSRS